MTHPVKFVQAIRPSRAGSFLFPLILAGLLLPAATWAQVTYTGTAANQNFGSQAVGSTSTAKTLSFSIAAGTTVGSIAVVTQGAPNLDFTEATGSTCAAQDYASAATCTVNVTFTPKAAGARYGAVVFSDGSGNTLATTYLGDANYAASATVSVTITITTGSAAPASTVILAPVPAIRACAKLDYEALVTSSSHSLPTGKVDLEDGNNVLATASLVNGKAKLRSAALTTGNHVLTARYEGDANHSPAVSSAVHVTVTGVGTCARPWINPGVSLDRVITPER